MGFPAKSSRSVCLTATSLRRSGLLRCDARRRLSSVSSITTNNRATSFFQLGPCSTLHSVFAFPGFRRRTTISATRVKTTSAARFFSDNDDGLHNDSEGTPQGSHTVGWGGTEALFLADMEESDDIGKGSDLSDSTGFHSPSSKTAPQTEPTSASAREALQQRRQLYARCVELHDVVQAELRAEVARDMKDGAAAVPPLAVAGWRVLHPTGSNYFTMTRVLPGCYTHDGRHGVGCAAEGAEAISSTPRYRSVYDVMTGKSNSRQSQRSTTASTSSLAQLRGTHFLHDHGDHARVRYARSDTHITLFAPFRTLDLTLYDPRLDICEWTRFDVLVRKSKPAVALTRESSAFHSDPSVTPLQGQQEIWDNGRCMFLRLACVNGELRIRSLQFVSGTLARALEERAVFGKGEPLYVELLRRQRHERTVDRAAGKDRWYTAVSPVNVFDAPGVSRIEASPTSTSASTLLEDALLSTVPADGANVLTSRFNRCGEYARTFAYAGPYLTELSKELREALQEYVMVNLGITSEVAEYVCQMQFFLEQEEYVAWLAQWGQLAAKLQRTL